MSGRLKDDVKTTADMVSIYTARFSIGNATGTLINSTDMKTVISGTANTTGKQGQFLLTMGSDNQYAQVLHWEAAVQQNAAATGSYELIPISGSGPAGTFTVQLCYFNSGSNSVIGTNAAVSGQSAAEVANAGLTGSIFAVLRDTKRPR